MDQKNQQIKRHYHAQAVANRMVERALWIINLENDSAHVSEETRSALLAETTDMLLQWAYEVGEENFRAGEFTTRESAAGELIAYPETPPKASDKPLGQ
ncbi:MAG: isocitrate dehydrogenase [Mobiluncus porci]|uniref:isocitrate dehydrogenase n=1 Tax=Mobiluncus porci TaxID=2652278 RepID=UPI0023F2E28D|nr:isocitrate dehydrogenase [Mobiluncus porci]MDD7541600.1 isocitrate dehydrogenase [Mobiluncus porci]MDY5748349.1 isocitrate dehydrogenase [Mobiluncus porci]